MSAKRKDGIKLLVEVPNCVKQIISRPLNLSASDTIVDSSTDMEIDDKSSLNISDTMGMSPDIIGGRKNKFKF